MDEYKRGWNDAIEAAAKAAEEVAASCERDTLTSMSEQCWFPQGCRAARKAILKLPKE